MQVIHALAHYPLERNYELLAQLMQTGSVICVINYRDGVRDVAHTIFSESRDGKGIWQVSARGYGYIYAFSKEDFVKQCGDINVEFIRPTTEAVG